MVEGREKWLFVPRGYLRSQKYGYRQLKLRDSGTAVGDGVRWGARDATLRGKTKGVMMGRRSLHFEPTLRPSARRSGGSAWWRAKRSRGRIYRRVAPVWPRIIALEERCRRRQRGLWRRWRGWEWGRGRTRRSARSRRDNPLFSDGERVVVFWYVTFRP